MEKLMTMREVNSALGRKDSKCRFVKELHRSGALNGAYIGKKLMFKESEVAQYIRKQFS